MRIKDLEAVEAIRKEAAQQLGTHPDDLEYFAWEQVFPNTTGPKGGIGGQALTKATIYAFRSSASGRAIVYSCGVWARIDNDFAPLQHVDFGSA